MNLRRCCSLVSCLGVLGGAMIGCGGGGGSGGGNNFTPMPVTLNSGLIGYAIGPSDTLKADVAIALGERGRVHMTYRDVEFELTYVSKFGNNWSSKNDWGRRVVGGYNSITTDQFGQVHIAATSDTGGEDLLYITSGTPVLVDSAASVGLESDILVDANGAVHISHWQWSGSNLRYTTNASGEWENFILNDNADWQPTAIEQDSSGALHIFYSSGNAIWHLTNASGQWLETPVPNLAAGPVAADIDNQDNIYVMGRNNLAVYANGAWSLVSIIHEMPFPLAPSSFDEGALEVDQNGHVHFCYSYNPNATWVLYASNILGEWRSAVVHGWGIDDHVDSDPALVVDDQGKVHMVLVNATDLLVYYTSFMPEDILTL